MFVSFLDVFVLWFCVFGIRATRHSTLFFCGVGRYMGKKEGGGGGVCGLGLAPCVCFFSRKLGWGEESFFFFFWIVSHGC